MTKYKGAILSLDLASTTGWAFGRPEQIPQFGHEKFGGSSRARTYRRFRLWLDLFCSAHKPDLIVFEAPIAPLLMSGKTNLDTILLLVGLAEHLEEWCEDRFELVQATIPEIRSHFLGRNLQSKIAKQLTMAKCRERGWMVENDNQGDACALWDYCVCLRRPDLGVASSPLFAPR